MTKLTAFPANSETALLNRRCCEIERENAHLMAALCSARRHRTALLAACIALSWAVAMLATLLSLTGGPR